MTAVSLSPIFNGGQLFTATGLPLAGGLITTYTAGTSTPLATYTDNTGTTPNSNPIVLDAGGYVTGEIWLASGSTYKFVVTDSLGLNPRTFDNITGITANAGPLSGTDLTVSGNTILGVSTTNTLNVGAGGLVKDSAGRVFIGSGKLGPNATNQHTIPNVTSDTFALLAAPQTFTNKTIGSTGLVMSNVAQAGATTLDWYEEGGFTPTLSFGGASTGITYNVNRGGTFTRIGNRMMFEVRMVITSKGSATGQARISGLPYAAASSGSPSEFVCTVDYSGLSGLMGIPLGLVTVLGTSVALVQTGAAATSALADTEFTNTSDLTISGSYRLDT